MTNVLLVFDGFGDIIRIYSVKVDKEELELLKNVHGTYVNGDMGKLTQAFYEFFYTEEHKVQDRFIELIGYVDFINLKLFYTYLFVVGHL